MIDLPNYQKLKLALTVSILLLELLVHGTANAQLNDSVNYRQVKYVKLNQANDLYTYWFQTDKYYSDGINIDFAFSFLNNKVSDKILWGVKNTPYKDFSFGINQDMYTPDNKEITMVDSTDRPYAGQLFVTYGKFSNLFWEGKKLTSKIYFGIQGPASLAGETQNKVHAGIGNNEVKGWDNQLSNGLILDYEVSYLQMIPISSSFTELHGYGILRAGTMNTSAEIGFRFKIGRYTDSYMNMFGIANRKNLHHFTTSDIAKMSSNRKKIIPKRIRTQSLEVQANYLSDKLNRKFQLYFFTEGSIGYLYRDGSVEGSLIQFSPNTYVYDYSNYHHFSAGGRYGFVLQYSAFYMEYERYLRTDAFNDNAFFGYGRIILSWVF